MSSKLRFWYLLLQNLTLTSTLSTTCPPSCKCSRILDYLEVNCAQSGLAEYPILDQVPVEHLDLSWNYLVEFPTQYAAIETLIYLDLSYNQIEYIDSDALYDFNALRTLILAHNSIASWASISPNEAFLSAPSLIRLSLSGNRLGGFTADNTKLILRSSSLMHLELERCDIKTIGGDQLINGLHKLEHLKLSHNALTNLNALPSKSLRFLELSNCNLPHFGGYMMKGWPSLESLNVSRNAGLQFGNSKNDLINSHTLNELDLSFCNLDNVGLSGLPNLTTLHMRNNMLRKISTNTFVNNTQLEVLDLSHNNLSLIANDAFFQLKRLNMLDLSYNTIARLEPNPIRIDDWLGSLNISQNVLEHVGWNERMSIESFALNGLKSIQRLDLSNNLLENFPGGMRSDTLQELKLSNCKLSGFPDHPFSHFPALTSLHLNGNQFRYPFSTAVFQYSPIDSIWLGDNPWICDCHAQTFRQFYNYLIEEQRLMDKNNVRCASPSSHSGQTVESACEDAWLPNASGGSNKFRVVMFTITVLSIFLACGLVYLRRNTKKNKRLSNQREHRRRQEEMRDTECQNQSMLPEDVAPSALLAFEMNLPSNDSPRQIQSLLQEDNASNTTSAFETNPPSYEEAIRMPKLK